MYTRVADILGDTEREKSRADRRKQSAREVNERVLQQRATEEITSNLT